MAGARQEHGEGRREHGGGWLEHGKGWQTVDGRLENDWDSREMMGKPWGVVGIVGGMITIEGK